MVGAARQVRVRPFSFALTAPYMTRRFEAEDLLLEQRITDIHVIPDHPIALCAVTWTDTRSRRTASSLWTFSLDSGEARRFTQGAGRVFSTGEPAHRVDVQQRLVQERWLDQPLPA